MEGDDEEEEEDVFGCLCGQLQWVLGDDTTISCDECFKWFHVECIGITPDKYKWMEHNGEKWFCPPCHSLTDHPIPPKTTLPHVKIHEYSLNHFFYFNTKLYSRGRIH